ncbi:MAG: acyl-CoA dehydrogenase family protein, partial [Chlamydiia bacterium]|nr:acyl-CoA dehydrogenase family protein [Chlamydiia bacterium]
GLSQVNYNRVMSAIASYCGSTAVLVSAHQSIGVPQPLKMYGTEAQKNKFMPRFAQGAISAFALTEPEVGSDPANLSTTAVLSEDGSHYILNGTKLWCTNGPIADLLVVMALTPAKIVNGRERKQITAFVVEGNSPGIEVLHRCDFMGLRGIHNGLLKFTNVKVPAENLIWGEGRGLALALGTLNAGRLTLPAACGGLAKACLHIARRWGNERVQWGSPIGRHEEGSQKLAFIASSTLAIEAVTWISSIWVDRADVDIRIEAAMAKYFCTELAWDIIDTTLQFRGGRGYERAASLKARGEEPFPVERMMRDCRINKIIEGTSEIMRLFLAREAMDPHLKRLGVLLKKSSSTGDKLQGALGLVGFYATWLPKQFINGSLFAGHSDTGTLAPHVKFVDRYAHKLARVLFLKMGRYQQALEQKQMLLARVVDIGTELFAMAATCSYAIHLEKTGQKGAISLANHFCTLATRRVKASFKALSDNDDGLGNRVAADILDGKLR